MTTFRAFRAFLYAFARFLGDVQAIRTGRIGRRLSRRIAGRLAGQALRRLIP